MDRPLRAASANRTTSGDETFRRRQVAHAAQFFVRRPISTNGARRTSFFDDVLRRLHEARRRRPGKRWVPHVEGRRADRDPGQGARSSGVARSTQFRVPHSRCEPRRHCTSCGPQRTQCYRSRRAPPGPRTMLGALATKCSVLEGTGGRGGRLSSASADP
jgi:hypothetical protein